MLAQKISYTEKELHRVDIEQIPLAFAACDPEGAEEQHVCPLHGKWEQQNKMISNILFSVQRLHWSGVTALKDSSKFTKQWTV